MLRLLMVDQDLEIVEVALAVVTPWPRQYLFDIGVTSLLLRHDGAVYELSIMASFKLARYEGEDNFP